MCWENRWTGWSRFPAKPVRSAMSCVALCRRGRSARFRCHRWTVRCITSRVIALAGRASLDQGEIPKDGALFAYVLDGSLQLRFPDGTSEQLGTGDFDSRHRRAADRVEKSGGAPQRDPLYCRWSCRHRGILGSRDDDGTKEQIHGRHRRRRHVYRHHRICCRRAGASRQDALDAAGFLHRGYGFDRLGRRMRWECRRPIFSRKRLCSCTARLSSTIPS